MVDVVAADDGAAPGVVAAAVDGRRVPGLQGVMMDLIAFDEVVVAIEQDARMRNMMDMVVQDAHANTARIDSGLVTWRNAAEMVTMILCGGMSRRGQRFIVAAMEYDGSATEAVDRAFRDMMVFPIMDNNAAMPKIADLTPGDFHRLAAFDVYSASAAVFNGEAVEDDVGNVLAPDENAFESSYHVPAGEFAFFH